MFDKTSISQTNKKNYDGLILLYFYWIYFIPLLCVRDLSLKNRNSLNQIKWSNELIGEPQLNLASLYSAELQHSAGSIFLMTHSLCIVSFSFFLFFLVPKCRTIRCWLDVLVWPLGRSHGGPLWPGPPPYRGGGLCLVVWGPGTLFSIRIRGVFLSLTGSWRYIMHFYLFLSPRISPLPHHHLLFLLSCL